MAEEVFVEYRHNEATVDALQLNPENQYDIVEALTTEAVNAKLSLLNIEFSTADQCYVFTYRYLTDSKDTSLAVGDYIIRTDAGNYKVMAAADFELRYMDSYKDADAMPANPKTPAKALVDFAISSYPDVGIKSTADLTGDKLGKLVNAMSSFYQEPLDQFTFQFHDASIVDPAGLAELINKIPKADFMKDTTHFFFNFNNGAAAPGEKNNQPNCFNRAGLDALYGELKNLDDRYKKNLYGLTFRAEGDGGALSAVAPSVTDEEWNEFCDNVMSNTGITIRNNIKR